MSDTPSFASTREALGMLHAVMGYLSADAGKMATEAQAECLLALEQLDAVKTATRARLLDAFNAGQGYAADADYSPRSWLIHRTRITKGAAAAHLAWVRRTAAHPRVAAALADGDVSESYARKICEWDDKLPRDCRDAADAILLAAARAGAQLTDLVELAAEIYTRSLPAGQPVKAMVHVSLAELRAMDDSALEDQWITEVRARWAARRAAASEGGSDGAAWLDGDAARSATCDAALIPVVTGEVDLSVLDDLVRMCVQLDRLEHDASRPDPASPSAEALQQAIIGKAADLLSGPGGLASFLRTRQLGAQLAGPSLPLDIGYSKTIPAGIRNAVILRDRRSRWAAAAISQPRPAKCTTSSTKPTAATPASRTACFCVRIITR